MSRDDPKLLQASLFFELEDEPNCGHRSYLNVVSSRRPWQKITQVPRVVIDETIKEPDAKEILDELDTWAKGDELRCRFFFQNMLWF